MTLNLWINKHVINISVHFYGFTEVYHPTCDSGTQCQKPEVVSSSSVSLTFSQKVGCKHPCAHDLSYNRKQLQRSSTVSQSVCHCTHGKWLTWHIAVPEDCSDSQLFGHSNVPCPHCCAEKLWKSWKSGIFSHVNVFLVYMVHALRTPRVHYIRQRHNLNCRSSERSALTKRWCIKYTTLYTVRALKGHC